MTAFQLKWDLLECGAISFLPFFKIRVPGRCRLLCTRREPGRSSCGRGRQSSSSRRDDIGDSPHTVTPYCSSQRVSISSIVHQHSDSWFNRAILKEYKKSLWRCIILFKKKNILRLFYSIGKTNLLHTSIHIVVHKYFGYTCAWRRLTCMNSGFSPRRIHRCMAHCRMVRCNNEKNCVRIPFWTEINVIIVIIYSLSCTKDLYISI